MAKDFNKRLQQVAGAVGVGRPTLRATCSHASHNYRWVQGPDGITRSFQSGTTERTITLHEVDPPPGHNCTEPIEYEGIDERGDAYVEGTYCGTCRGVYTLPHPRPGQTCRPPDSKYELGRGWVDKDKPIARREQVAPPGFAACQECGTPFRHLDRHARASRHKTV